MEYLRVEDFRKKFSQTEVLKGVDFSLQKGEILVIIGASGSGKTTLLRCLNFLETPDEGRIYLGGELLSDASVRYSDRELRQKRLKFGLVFQNFNLFPNYNARRNVSLACELLAKSRVRAKTRELRAAEKGLSKWNFGKILREAKAFKREEIAKSRLRAEELLGEVGLGDRGDAYPYELSGGQQQRVAIARALALDPEVLCFDEPTSALDPELTGEVRKVIRGLKGRTMIIVTHEMAFAREVADRVIFMADGKIEEMGSGNEVFGRPKSEKLKAFLKRTEEHEW